MKEGATVLKTYKLRHSKLLYPQWKNEGSNMKNLALILAAISVLFTISGCASKRNITTFKTETGELKCAEPPPDVVTTGARANIEALVPQIDVDVKANANANTTVARIRSEIPNLQAVEALEYRMCLAYGNGIVDSATYREFYQSILPMLQGIKAQGASAEQTLNIEERRNYSGVSGCNDERSKRVAEAACNEGGGNYASRNGLQLVSARLVSFTHDIDSYREPWPSNARSCNTNVVANCEIVVKER